MKKLLLVLFLICSHAQANEVTCYSDGHLVYSHHAHEITFAGDLLYFIEDGSDKEIITYMDCMVKMPA